MQTLQDLRIQKETAAHAKAEVRKAAAEAKVKAKQDKVEELKRKKEREEQKKKARAICAILMGPLGELKLKNCEFKGMENTEKFGTLLAIGETLEADVGAKTDLAGQAISKADTVLDLTEPLAKKLAKDIKMHLKSCDDLEATRASKNRRPTKIG